MSLLDLDTGDFVSSYNEDNRTIYDEDTGEFISFLEEGEWDDGLSLPYYSFAWLEVIARNNINNYLLSQWKETEGHEFGFVKLSEQGFRKKDYYLKTLFKAAFYSIEERGSGGNHMSRWAKKKILRNTQTERVLKHVWRSYPELRRWMEDQGLIHLG
ncbi:TPA: hypothetical protein RQK28_000683 [Vibrio vulnificus]|nr:hypothetical protein [Vibrio vulnificus]